MLSWMESAEAKMARAKEHLDAFCTEAHLYLRSSTIENHLFSNENNAWIVCHFNGPRVPIRLGILLGECVFNMRSALDNLVCALMRMKNSHAPCKGTQFPIIRAQQEWENRRGVWLNGVEPAAQTFIRKLQPFNRRPDNPDHDPLSILNDLCNSDKHRAMTPALPLYLRFLAGGAYE
jgi:hypothetical protein